MKEKEMRKVSLGEERMKELGFTKVYNMLGRITQWEAEGLPTIK